MTTWAPDKMEQVRCDLCGGGSAQEIFRRPDHLIAVECKTCGLCYLNPRPKPEQISRFYEADYFVKALDLAAPTDVGYSNYYSERNRETFRRVAQEKFAVIQQYLDVRSRRCLEVGCATGEFTYLLHNHGAQVLGIDLSARAVEEARVRYPGIPFRSGDITTLPGQPFDVICAFEVIEHVVSPMHFLLKVAELLTPGGYFILTTPNYDCGQSAGLARWRGFKTSFEHLYFLNSTILMQYGMRVGLSTVDWLTDTDDGLVQSPVPPMKAWRRSIRQVRHLLRQSHFMEPLRSWKRKWCDAKVIYSQHGHGHNLLMLMSKLDGRS